MSTSKTQKLPSDPLAALGPSLFLQIISHLPLPAILCTTLLSRSYHGLVESHRTSIYRRQALEIGVEKQHFKVMLAMERAMASASLWQGEPDDPDAESAAYEPVGSVDWRMLCIVFLKLKYNWRYGRATETYLTPGRNTIWRLKVDKEEKTLITTSRIDGILVSDLETSEPIFEYEDGRRFPHLEFAKGFVVFNVGNGPMDNGLEVHLTPSALRRLPSNLRSNLPDPSRSKTYGTGYSWPLDGYYDPKEKNLAKSNPPKGHLTYYRTITPPTPCFAFRARIDRENEEGARAVLGTAGEEGIYIYDLEQEGKVERYVVPPAERQQPKYIEFDDEYIFICSSKQLHVYSRAIRAKLLSFPNIIDDSSVGAVYVCPPRQKFYRAPNPRQASSTCKNTVYAADDGKVKGEEAWIGRADMSGVWRTDDKVEVFNVPKTPKFTACHYTTSDLYCTTESGLLLVIRSYKTVFALSDADERKRAIRDNTIMISFDEPLTQLTTHGEHVVCTTTCHIYIIDGETLPTGPFINTATGSTDKAKIPKIPILSIDSINKDGMKSSSCLQADRESIYAVYDAQGDERQGGITQPDYMNQGSGTNRQTRNPPERATGDAGICIKKWDFGVDNGL